MVDIPFVGQKENTPVYSSSGAAGADLKAFLDKAVLIEPGERRMIPTGLKLAVPEGYEIQIRPRSGLAIKKGLTVLNSPGTIDSDYRGEISIILINLGNETVSIEPGERIAQMILAPVSRAHFCQVQEISTTDRAGGGFGSTGTK